jgi:hypothetical protein
VIVGVKMNFLTTAGIANANDVVLESGLLVRTNTINTKKMVFVRAAVKPGQVNKFFAMPVEAGVKNSLPTESKAAYAVWLSARISLCLVISTLRCANIIG